MLTGEGGVSGEDVALWWCVIDEDEGVDVGGVANDDVGVRLPSLLPLPPPLPKMCVLRGVVSGVAATSLARTLRSRGWSPEVAKETGVDGEDLDRSKGPSSSSECLLLAGVSLDEEDELRDRLWAAGGGAEELRGDLARRV